LACLTPRYGPLAAAYSARRPSGCPDGLNAIGAYGFLAKAHIGHAVDGDVAMVSVAAEIDANVAIQAGVVADLDRRIAQIDGAVDKATTKGRTKSAMELATDQRRVRAELVAQRTAEAKTIAGLQVEPRSMAYVGRSRRTLAPLNILRPCSASATTLCCACSSLQ
jgi:hypothetical protein